MNEIQLSFIDDTLTDRNIYQMCLNHYLAQTPTYASLSRAGDHVAKELGMPVEEVEKIVSEQSRAEARAVLALCDLRNK